MKRKSLYFFVITSALFVGSCCYGAASSSSQASKGIEGAESITAATLLALAQKESPVPATVQSKFDEWQREKIDAWLKQLLSFKFTGEQPFRSQAEAQAAVRTFQAKKQQDDAMLRQNGFENKSPVNYIFQLPGTGYIAKIAGPANRFMNVKMEKGLRYSDRVSAQILKDILSGKTPTYQTASRMATYLVLKDLIDRNGFKSVAVPETHLISYGGGTAVDDSVAIVVTKMIPEKAEKVTAGNIAKVTPGMIKEFVRAIAVGGLWSDWGNGNLFVDADKLYIVDLEQPNNSKPSDFFHQNVNKYHSDVWVGIDELLKLLQHDKAKLAVAVQAIKDDPFLNSPDFKEKARINGSIKKYSQ